MLVTKFGLAGPSFLHPTQKYATIGQNSSHSERKRSFSMARSDGYNTKTRQLILDYLINNRQHAVSASNILEHLEEQGASPNPTTVYRYLDKLAGEQRIMKYVADKGEKAVFQYVDEGRHCREHLHLPSGLPLHGRSAGPFDGRTRLYPAVRGQRFVRIVPPLRTKCPAAGANRTKMFLLC